MSYSRMVLRATGGFPECTNHLEKTSTGNNQPKASAKHIQIIESEIPQMLEVLRKNSHVFF